MRARNEPNAPVVDTVRAPEYLFARSRDGRLRTVGRLRTDGAVAVVPGSWGKDIHGLQLTEAYLDGELLVRTTQRCDLNLRFLDPRRVLVTARNFETALHANLLWAALPPMWRTALKGGGSLERVTADHSGIPQGDSEPVSLDEERNAVIPHLADGRPVLVKLLSGSWFVRGDANADGTIDIADAVAILAYLFGGAGEPSCLKALDVEDGGKIDIADAVFLLASLFADGPPPPSPGSRCGPDPTADELPCAEFPACP